MCQNTYVGVMRRHTRDGIPIRVDLVFQIQIPPRAKKVIFMTYKGGHFRRKIREAAVLIDRSIQNPIQSIITSASLFSNHHHHREHPPYLELLCDYLIAAYHDESRVRSGLIFDGSEIFQCDDHLYHRRSPSRILDGFVREWNSIVVVVIVR